MITSIINVVILHMPNWILTFVKIAGKDNKLETGFKVAKLNSCIMLIKTVFTSECFEGILISNWIQ